MQTRQLDNAEWVHFFNGFSRQFRGRPMTVRVIERGGACAPRHENDQDEAT